jgi:hypothetical protein
MLYLLIIQRLTIKNIGKVIVNGLVIMKFKINTTISYLKLHGMLSFAEV